MAYVTTVPFMGKQIVRIDFNGCLPGRYAPVIEEAMKTISSAPPDTVLAMTLLSNIRFDPGTVIEMERFAQRAQPFLKGNALVGVDGLKKIVFLGIRPLYRKPVDLFDTEESAKHWLATR